MIPMMITVAGWIGMRLGMTLFLFGTIGDSGGGHDGYSTMHGAEERGIEGKLQLPAGIQVASRVRIQEDGSYTANLAPGRKLVFLAHGYDPLVIAAYEELNSGPYDAGIQAFQPAVQENLRTVMLTPVLTGPGAGSVPIHCNLDICNDCYLWMDEGYECGAPVTVKVESRAVFSGQPVRFDGLSRIPYFLKISADGYIEQRLPIDPQESGQIDLGECRLRPSNIFHIRYRARVRQNGGPWIGGDEVQGATVECDGDNEFQFSQERDGLGNSLTLRMTPLEDGKVHASFFYHAHGFHPLGKTRIEEVGSWADMEAMGSTGMNEVPVEAGELYFFRVDDINGTEIELLFQPHPVLNSSSIGVSDEIW